MAGSKKGHKRFQLALQRDKRIGMAEQLLTEQHTGREIVRRIVAKFRVHERTAYTALADAYERVQADASDDRPIRKARMRRTWQAHYQRCVAAGNFQAANVALDRLCKIDGLYAPEKIEHSGTISVAMQMRQVITVLDAAGIAALEIVIGQLEAAGVKGQLPAGIAQDSTAGVIDVGDEDDAGDPLLDEEEDADTGGA